MPAEMDGSVRRCRQDDACAVAAIYDPIVAGTVISFEDAPPGPEELRRRIGEAGDRFPWLAFEREGAVLGYAYASAHRTRAAYRWAVDVGVYVAPEAHRCGIARRLYATLFDVLASQGYCAAFAGVALPNEASCNLHLRVGFGVVGTYHQVGFKFGRWHDVMWFERRLRSDAQPTEPRPLERDAAAPPATSAAATIDATD